MCRSVAAAATYAVLGCGLLDQHHQLKTSAFNNLNFNSFPTLRNYFYSYSYQYLLELTKTTTKQQNKNKIA